MCYGRTLRPWTSNTVPPPMPWIGSTSSGPAPGWQLLLFPLPQAQLNNSARAQQNSAGTKPPMRYRPGSGELPGRLPTQPAAWASGVFRCFLSEKACCRSAPVCVLGTESGVFGVCSKRLRSADGATEPAFTFVFCLSQPIYLIRLPVTRRGRFSLPGCCCQLVADRPDLAAHLLSFPAPDLFARCSPAQRVLPAPLGFAKLTGVCGAGPA